MSHFNSNQAPIVVHIVENLQDVAEQAYLFFSKQLLNSNKQKQSPVFILPTGSTPLAFYKKIIFHFMKGELNLSKAHFFNLDEYANLSISNKNSYAYYLKQHLYSYLSKDLNLEKLEHFNLRFLTSKECPDAQKRSLYNQMIHEFSACLIKTSLSTKSHFDELAQKSLLCSKQGLSLTKDYLNNKTLTSLDQLYHNLKLFSDFAHHCPLPENIHFCPSQLENTKYGEQIKNVLDSPNYLVTCFMGLGASHAHLAFNELITEDFFLDEKLSHSNKNQIALNTCLRKVTLSKSTRMANCIHFSNHLNEVPCHAITLGLSEILKCDHLVILATGAHKLESVNQMLTKPPSCETPASLLQLSNHPNIQLILDSQSFGIGKKNSLFYSIKNKKNLIPLKIIHLKKQLSFFEVPFLKKPALIENSFCTHLDNGEIVQLPKHTKILWIKHKTASHHFLKKLKQGHNEIKISTVKKLDLLFDLIHSYSPDLIFFPFIPTFIEHQKIIASHLNNIHETLGIFYETHFSLENAFFSLSSKSLNKKLEVLNSCYRSQMKRSHYLELVLKQASYRKFSLKKQERFAFYRLQKMDKGVKKIPFDKSTLFKPSFFSFRKKAFSFLKNDLVISISPHQDDTEIGLGGLLQKLEDQRIQTFVFQATSGHRAQISKADLDKHPYLPDEILKEIKTCKKDLIDNSELKKRIRFYESKAAISQLNKDAKLFQFNFPFYEQGFLSEKDHKMTHQIISNIPSSYNRWVIFLPFMPDQHTTHELTTQLFEKAFSQHAIENSSIEIILAYYNTPWTGHWNLYDYSDPSGTELNALIGAELIIGKGEQAYPPLKLGGKKAKRYQAFYFKNSKHA